MREEREKESGSWGVVKIFFFFFNNFIYLIIINPLRSDMWSNRKLLISLLNLYLEASKKNRYYIYIF